MNTFAWQPGDVGGFRRWLRNHLVCVLSLAAFLVLIRHAGTSTHEPLAETNSMRQSQIGTGPTATAWAMDSTQGEVLPPETDLTYLPMRTATAVAPQGWRRTERGWEHVSTWQAVPRRLEQIVMDQEQRETGWMNSTLSAIRKLPPLAFATLQLTAISAIVWLSRRDRRDTKGE